MKQKLLYILMIITALIGGNAEAWAQTTSSVLNESAEVEIMTGGSISKPKTYTWSGPGYQMTFKHKRGGAATGGINVEFKNANGETLESRSYTPSSSYSSDITVNVPIDARQVKFSPTGTARKWIKDVKVTRATTLSAPSTVDMGEVKIGKTISAQVNVSFNNTTYNQTLTGSCDNSAFSVVSRSMGETGTVPVTINFSPKTAGKHTGTVTLSMNGVTAKFTVTGSAQDKGTPAFTWTLSNLATGREYTDFFTSTNTDTPVSFVSSDASIANVVEGKLVTSSKEGTATITVTQQGNDDWHEKSQSFTVNVSKPQNHLPLAINESNWSVLARNISGGSFKWDGGIQHHSLAYGNREFELAFEGIPDKLTFNHKVTDSNIDSEVKWTVYEGPDGNSFTEAWTTGTNNGTATVQLKPTTRYVRIKCYCIYYENISNIQISELRYLTTETTSLDFGENIQDELVAAQTFILKHCNAGYGVEIESSDPENFSISPSQLESTGGDKMGEERITVTYLNKNVGEHQGTITIGDPNGVNTPITINVTGSTLSNALELDPNQKPNYEVRKYKKVVLKRKLPKEKHFTLTIPFDYNISGIEGAYVAQLAFVTHNQFDSYTLYFKKLESGQMTANQPYIVWLPDEIPDLVCNDVEVVAPKAKSVNNDRTQGWTMQGNYEPGFSMDGLYGIAGGQFRLGTQGSTINAYTAYFTFFGTEKLRARVAVMDEGGNTTYIGELSDLNGNAPEEVFGIDGMRLPEMRKGINIVRQKDGSVRKIVK